MMKFVCAESEEQLSRVRELFTEYAASLDFYLCFQDFEKELAEPPGEYAPPYGCIILATDGAEAVGCVALRKIAYDTCEMKRLYVRPEFRRKGIGRSLVAAIIEEARKRGYTYMRLETLPSMGEAIALYRSLGFSEVEPYRCNPLKGAMFMELTL